MVKPFLNWDLLQKKTQELLEFFRQIPEVLAAKGCGAMGADMMILLCKSTHLKLIKEKVRQKRLRYIADEKQLTTGIEVQNFDQNQKGYEHLSQN